MVSLDSAEKNAAFAEALGANFTLLSDPSGEAARAYGVIGLSRFFAKRWTFYIDLDGTVRKIDKSVDPAQHGEEIARTLTELEFQKSDPTASP
jgi:peroxiredoxin Q/BCP